MNDKTILDHIAELVDEENRLLNDTAASPPDHQRIEHIAQQLDLCWDLLRQRRASREFGGDPDKAAARDVRTVEGYQG